MGAIFVDFATILYFVIQNLKRCFNYHYIYFLCHVGRLASCISQRKFSRLRNVYKLIDRSFFQSACMLGYCLFPLNVVSFITMLIGKFIPSPIKLTLVILSFIWATLCNFMNIFSFYCLYGITGARKKKKACVVPSMLVLSVFELVCFDCLKHLLY